MLTVLSSIQWGIDPELFHIGGFGLRYYTLCFMLAFFLSYVILLSIFKREGKSQELLDKLTIYVFIGTVLGARLGHCLFYEFDYYKDHLLEMILPIRTVNGTLTFTGYQGLASHGGAIGIIVALILYCRKTKVNFWWIADRLVIVAALSGALIRTGNFFNSEIIGKPSQLPWSVVFTHVDNIPRHPAQLYESMGYLVIFIILFNLYKKSKFQKPAFLFGFFMVTVFGLRFLMEFVKENQESFESAMTLNMGQILSIPFIAIGFYFMFKSNNASGIAQKK
ncbi:prolipoprotein diacylglyceryl transferase [Olivibacter domesticus]|uniref:Phosphatidylglycerol--prolipoprotein diacylglyceryl transferase n=1 Tax=Olivibacter domesticus TaxID=407022 RepID=A0A1H7PNV9_OLID1|nr:prolipoprotein diacylglyceryl transferase [Olivibacter domesticus]SEL36935.1 prolipoprotein diacylglyceryl transferase [Olivibacter domesticus]